MEPQGAIPWYKSKIVSGALVSLVSKLLVTSGIMPDVLGSHSADIANIVVTGIGMIGDGVVLKSRLGQKTAPAVVLTKKTVTEAEEAHATWMQLQQQLDSAANEPQTRDELPPFAFPFLGQADALSQERAA